MPDFPFDARELVVDLRSTELVARLPFIGQALSPASAQRENLSPAFLEWRRRGLNIYLVQIAPVAHAELDAWLEDKGPAPRSSFSVLSDALPMTPTTAQLPKDDVVMREAGAMLEFKGKTSEEGVPLSPGASLGHDRVVDEPLTEVQHEAWDRLASSQVGRDFKREDCLRALLTCFFHEERASKLLVRTAAWWSKYKPHLVTAADLQNSLPSRCWQPGGVSKHGWPIIEVFVERWRPFDYDNEEQNRLIGFFFNLILARHPNAERFAILFNMEGWRLALGMPQPLHKVFTMIEIAQNEFCERIGAVLLINVPPIFQLTWKIIAPLMHERVAPRVKLFGTDWRPEVLQLIDEDNLPTTLGGLREETPVV